MKQILTTLLALHLICLAFTAQAKTTVVVSIPPQNYFAQKIGGDLVSVTVMTPPGASAHTYEPRPRQMEAVAKARLYFAVGVEFEKSWLPRFLSANPNLTIVHTEARVKRVPMKADHHKAAHGHKGHANHGLDPHIWLAPRLVMTQARAMHAALVKADPGHQKTYDQNLAVFINELEALDRKLAQAFKGLGHKRRILVFHPAWGYFCRAYGLTQVAVEQEGKSPTAKGLKHLISQARRNQAKVIFVQPRFSPRMARVVARELKAKVVPIDPLSPKWAQNLEHVAFEVRKAAY